MNTQGRGYALGEKIFYLIGRKTVVFVCKAWQETFKLSLTGGSPVSRPKLPGPGLMKMAKWCKGRLVNRATSTSALQWGEAGCQ